MAGVQGMAFTASGLPPSANKEKGGFCWRDMVHEAGSAEQLFDEYIQLGDSDTESAVGGAGGASGFGHFSGASELSFSPHLSSFQMLPSEGGQAQSHLASVVGGVHGDSNSNNDNFSGNDNPGSARSMRRQHELHPSYRTSSNMRAFSNAELDMEADGLPYSSLEAPGGGSISDSELLRLEGLTMRSPRLHIPQLSASEPASPPSKPVSPRKTGRLETFCSKIRNKAATLQGKAKESGIKAEPREFSAPVMSTARMDPARSSRPRPQQLRISKSQLPSPPLTSGMLPEQRPVAGGSGDASFVNGFLDDPFTAGALLTGPLVPPLQLNGNVIPPTPLQSHLLDAWQLPMSTPNSKPLWAANTYVAGVNGDAGWWDLDAMDTDVPLSYHAPGPSMNLLAFQHQQTFEYPAPPGTEDTPSFGVNGLIHMPQPRGIPPTVLHGSDHRPTRADHRRPNPRAPSSGVRHRQYGPGISPRKGRTASTNGPRIGSVSPGPRPHAAAAGAGNSSGGRLHRRSASMQTLHHHANPAAVMPSVDGPASAVRKRRSWTGRRTASSSSSSLHHQHHHALASSASTLQPGYAATNSNANGMLPSKRHSTPSTTTTATSIPPHLHQLTPQPPSSSTATIQPDPDPPLQPGQAIAATKDGFVNYTPHDHALLMTGVAPSGSSKTKARREREAAERQREFRERLARMVRAAGGDVRKLGKLSASESEYLGGEGRYRDREGGYAYGGDDDGDGGDSGEGEGV